MSALDALLVEHHQFCDYLYCTVGDSARAELAAMRADLQAAQERIAQLEAAVIEVDKAMVGGELIYRRKRQSDNDPYHSATIAITKAIAQLEAAVIIELIRAANPAPEAEPQP